MKTALHMTMSLGLAFTLALALMAPSLPADDAGNTESMWSEFMQDMRRTLGLDRWNFSVVERDERTGKPTLERSSTDELDVERKTRFHSNGVKASQETVAKAKSHGKAAYVEKNTWDRQGRPTREYVESAKFNAKGEQLDGETVERRFERGRKVRDLRKRWSKEEEDWSQTRLERLAYYEDGSLKERLVDDSASKDKSRERWGERRDGTRKKSVQRWNQSRESWE